MVLPDGPAVLTSPSGNYDIEEEQVSIPGILQFSAADGYRLTARNVLIDLPSRTIMGNGRVEGTVPAGSFEADQMRADLEARELTLSGNARMHMVPGRLQMPKEID